MLAHLLMQPTLNSVCVHVARQRRAGRAEALERGVLAAVHRRVDPEVEVAV